MLDKPRNVRVINPREGACDHTYDLQGSSWDGRVIALLCSKCAKEVPVAGLEDELIALADKLEADAFENWDSVAKELRAIASRFSTRSVGEALDSASRQP